MTTVSTPAPSGHPDAPAIPAFDPNNAAHQRAWQSVLNMGRVDTEQRAREERNADEPDVRAVQHFADALALYMDARKAIVMEPPAETDEEEQELDRLTDRLTAAEEYVMSYGAPDWCALLAKVEIAAFDGRQIKPDHLDSIKADIMRLASLDRSPTFLPVEWLDRFERYQGRPALIHRKDEGWIPTLGCPTDSERASRMLRDLEDHERAAIGDFLRGTLDPRDFGAKEA